MQFSFKIHNVAALQTFQFLRFTAFLIISICFAKIPWSKEDIASWEMLLFISGGLSFFWVTGILQSFLPLSQRNKVFMQSKRVEGKSPEIFNAFILLMLFSFAFALLILLMFNLSPSSNSKIAYPWLLVTYFILSNSSALTEHIFLIKNKPQHIFWNGIVSTIIQIFAVCVPAILGFGVQGAFYGLIFASMIRFGVLIFLLSKYAEYNVSIPFILNNLYVGYPIMISALLSGSSQYVDSLVASIVYDAQSFTIFRYGAKELPFVVIMTSGLNNALIPAFSIKKNIPSILSEIKRRSLRQMHILFPLSILVMLFSKVIFGQIFFNDEFYRSADIFMVYQLMIISRVVFPQTIIIGLKKTNILMWTAFMNILLTIPLSFFMVQKYLFTGIALSSCIIHVVEKMILMWYNHKKIGISPVEYTPLRWYAFYTLLIGIVFILIDRRIIFII
jgi:O-antigen/teichoic acid export membrane protein